MNRDERITKANKGFSLVELIIAVAILVIVVGSVCSFIVISSRNYANGNNDISVQQEAQLALNQMSDVIIDATRSINYVGYDSASQPFKALKDAEFAFTPENKALIVYNVETTVDDGTPSPTPSPTADGLQNYMFYWQKSTEDLYFAVQGADGSFPFPGDAECVLLAEHVTDFRVDLSEVEAKRVVKLCIVFEVGNKKCEIANNITVRNKVLINDAEIAPLNKSKTISVKAKEPSVILEPGEEFHFSTPKVTGMNITDKSVKWSIVGTVAAGTKFKDEANGILQIAGNEKQAEFEVMITTNDKNSDNVQATDKVKVYVKRVTKVELYKQSDDFDGDEEDRPGSLEVEQGATFVIGANVEGVKLLSPCSGCDADYATDKDVTDFKILSGKEYVTLDDSSVPSSQATFTLDEETLVGTTIKIQAASVLSKRHTSTYGVVYGEITLTVVEKTNKAKPYDGILKHGISTKVDDILISGFITEVSNHVLAVHVVDNETKEVIEVLCMDDGWNMWISPDLFDLDLKKSYTFYLQAISSVSIEDYEEWKSNGGRDTNGEVPVSSKEDIWEEYSTHKQTKAPYGYTGTKYQCSEVYGTVLEPVVFTYSYKGKLYCGEQFTLDTFNIVKEDIGNNQVNILQDVKFERASGKNIDANSLDTGVKYSVYKGEGTDPSGWKWLYVYDDKNKQYYGATWLYEGNLEIGDYANMRSLKLKTGSIDDTSGTYHIVPGYEYMPKIKAEEHAPKYILGPEGFEFPYNSAKPKYYELEESTYHITVTAEGTMDMDCSEFKGSVCFPLPKEMKEQTYFTDMDSTDWQEANLGTSGLELSAIDADGNLVKCKFDKIRYHKIENENAYEVEPIKVTKLHQNDDLYLEVTYSYGIYKCAATGTKWDCETAAGKTATNATFSFKQSGKTYLAYLPLPTDKNFMFERGKTERQTGKCWFFGFGQDEHGKILETDKLLFGTDTVYCDYDSATGVYTLTFVESTTAMPAGDNPVRTILNIKGQYQWKTGQSSWSYKQGQGRIIESHANLVTTYNGQSIETYLAPPTDTGFWGKVWDETDEAGNQLTWQTLYFFPYPADVNNANGKDYQGCTIDCKIDKGEKQIAIYQKNFGENANFGTFRWDDALKQWISQTYS